MSKRKKVRCPHCGEINTIDAESELKRHEQFVLKHMTRRNIGSKPEAITVLCSNPDCRRRFKVNL